MVLAYYIIITVFEFENEHEGTQNRESGFDWGQGV